MGIREHMGNKTKHKTGHKSDSMCVSCLLRELLLSLICFHSTSLQIDVMTKKLHKTAVVTEVGTFCWFHIIWISL